MHAFYESKSHGSLCLSPIRTPLGGVRFWCPLSRQSKIVGSSRGQLSLSLCVQDMWKMELKRKWNRKKEQQSRNLNLDVCKSHLRGGYSAQSRDHRAGTCPAHSPISFWQLSSVFNLTRSRALHALFYYPGHCSLLFLRTLTVVTSGALSIPI